MLYSVIILIKERQNALWHFNFHELLAKTSSMDSVWQIDQLLSLTIHYKYPVSDPTLSFKFCFCFCVTTDKDSSTQAAGGVWLVCIILPYVGRINGIFR